LDFNIIKEFLKVDNEVIKMASEAFERVKEIFINIENIKVYNQLKVLTAFQKNKASDIHFNSTQGYGYSDLGRDVIERIYSDIFKSEDSLVRIHISSGTQAIALMMFSILRPNYTLLSITGEPYDTLQKVIGIKKGGFGTLRQFGINYKQVNLVNDEIDLVAVKRELNIDKSIKVVFIQRSRGYSLRNSIDIDKIMDICKHIKSIRDDVTIVVDNCYGEFVEKMEPIEAGADLVAGSLIKNPGGTLAPSGGYICGRKDLILGCADRLYAPGVGKEIGPSLGYNKDILQGLFYAPNIVAESLKIAIWTSSLMDILGFEVHPKYNQKRTDIIQVIKFDNQNDLINFCKGIQKGCPIDSFVEPEPWDMPGYDSKVIMAAGGFVQGASIELSCDAPIREPYAAYLQGGWNFESGVFGVLNAIQNIRKM